MGMYLTQALHRAARGRPGAVATVFGNRRQTYAELHGRVAQLGGLLGSLSIAPQDRVGWLILNSDRVFELMLGSFWIGAIACPLNTRWSISEVVDAINDCSVKMMILGEEFCPMLDELRARCPSVDTWLVLGDDPAPEGSLHYESSVNAAVPCDDCIAQGDDAAFILYTGGTTSKPKGVVQTHAAVGSAGLGLAAMIGPSGPVSLMVAPLFHMGAIQQAFYHILDGGTFVFTPSFVPAETLALIRREKITDTLIVPTMLQALLGEIEKAPDTPLPLRRLLYGAAPASVALLEKAQRLLPDTDFFQGFGMSETALTCMLTADDHRNGQARHSGIVGRPCPHAEVRVVDPEGCEVEPGIIGEITVRGPSVSPGYWHNAAETNAAFRNGWIHTGDAGFFDAEGYLRLVDRIKDMIVTGGENVYSAEVENAVARHGAVDQCAVVGRPHDFWGEAVHVAIVLRPGTTLTLDELLLHCRDTLAGYKCPRTMEILVELPLTPTGKVAKNRLRALLAEANMIEAAPVNGT